MEEKNFPIVDAHCDSVMMVDELGWKLNNGHNLSAEHPALQLFAMFVGRPEETPLQNYETSLRYMGIYRGVFAEQKENLEKVTTMADIERVLGAGKNAAMLSVEGAGNALMGDPTGDFRRTMKTWYDEGVRVLGLAWRGNEMTASHAEHGDADYALTEAGRAAVAYGNELGMIFDVSHSSDKAFWELDKLSRKPLVATHSNFRGLCPHQRNITDDMAKRIAERGGMIGFNLCTDFLSTTDAREVDVYEQMEYALNLVGEDCIGFGCDIDGLDGVYPKPLNEGSSLHDQMLASMRKRGFSERIIRKIAGENWLNFFRRNL